MNAKTLVAVVTTALSVSFARADIYVDAAADPQVADGTVEHPYATIQAAVNAASSGATIRIAAGVYDQGGVAVEGSTSSRVLIQNKTLHLIGAGRGQTVICGTYGTSTYGYGPGAWRCVQVDNGDGTILEKMTLKGGATVNSSVSKYNSVSGGGLLVCNGSNVKAVYVVDSDFVGCCAVWGGAARNGTLVRCLLDGSLADNGLAACGSRLVNCVVTRCKPTTITEGVVNSSEVYNCTLVDNAASYALTAGSSAYGSVIVISSTKAETESSTTTECVLGQSAAKGPVQVLAPAVGDWRLLVGSDAVGAVAASRLTDLDLPAGIDPMVDFSGAPIVAKSGRIDAGALQGTVTPAAGGIYFRYNDAGAPVIANGRTNAYHGISWVFPDVYPTQYVFTACAAGQSLCRLARIHANGQTNMQLGFAPALDGTFSLLPPPTVGSVVTNYFEFASAEKTVWTDAENGKDDWGSGVTDAGSEAHPYKTLAKAVTALGGCTSGTSVIFAKPGVYDEGTMSNDYGTFRVAITAGTYGRVRLVAVEGPEKTFIVGEPDPGSTVTGTYAGCGPDAVRGVYLKGRNDVSIQGFTICGCYSSSQTQYQSRCRGAAVYSGTGYERAQVTDCIISNNYALTSVVSGGLLKRCRILENHANNAVFMSEDSENTPMPVYEGNAAAYFCSFVSNDVTTAGGDSQGVVGGAARVYNCTFVGEPRTGRLVSGKAAYNFSSVFDGGEKVFSAAMLTNCVLWNYETSSYNKQTEKILADPKFVNRAAGDYRVRSDSPCVGYGAPVATDAYFWGEADAAIDGPIGFDANGRSVAGAFQRTVAVLAVRVEAAQGGLSVTGGVVGDNVVYEGGELAFAPVAGPRPCVGVAAGGETFLFSNAPSRRVVLSYETLKSSSASSVAAVYASAWYVDDENGNDGNTGFFADDARKTLAVAAADLQSGDTLFVAPGDYATGSNRYDATYATWARVKVNAGATVVATAGPEVTRLVGENGVRGAIVDVGGRLSGFTVTGGDATADASLNERFWLGGGVLGTDGQGRCLTKGILVDNCIISNNVARNGGAAVRVNLIGCRVVGNRSLTESGEIATVYQSSAYGCHIDDNVARVVFEYCQNVVGCSVGTENRRLDDSVAPLEMHYGSSPADKARFLNSVLRAPLQTGDGNGYAAIRNCALLQGSFYGAKTEYDETTCAKLPAAEMPTESDGSSVLGTFPVDAADVALFDLADAVYSGVSDLTVFSNSLAVVKNVCCGAKDLNGNQRVYDAVQDLGCFETDWRARFARALGRSYLTVPAASAGVRVTDENRLALGTDDALTVSVTFAPDVARRAYVRAQVSGTGSLEMRIGGETVATVVAADGQAERVLSFPAETDSFELAFVGDGSAEVFGCRREGAGLITIIR